MSYFFFAPVDFLAAPFLGAGARAAGAGELAAAGLAAAVFRPLDVEVVAGESAGKVHLFLKNLLRVSRVV